MVSSKHVVASVTDEVTRADTRPLSHLIGSVLEIFYPLSRPADETSQPLTEPEVLDRERIADQLATGLSVSEENSSYPGSNATG